MLDDSSINGTEGELDMKKKLTILAVVMAVIVIAVSAVIIYIDKGNKEAADLEDGHIRVVTSFYPAYILTINLTEDIPDLKVDSLSDFSDGCMHDYHLTTKDMRMLSHADIFIINGGGLEEYLEDVIESYPELTVINLSQGIEMLPSQVHDGGDNPHIWMNPELYMQQINNASQGLESYIQNKKDKDGRYRQVIEQLTANSEGYLEKVGEVADEMNRLLDTVNDMIINKNISNKVVLFHDSFAYLAEKAGLEVAYTVEVDEHTSLSAGEVAEVIKAIKDENIRYLFTEHQYDDTISDRIKAETDAKLYVIDSAVSGEPDKDAYLRAMRENIETLKKAFEEFM